MSLYKAIVLEKRRNQLKRSNNIYRRDDSLSWIVRWRFANQHKSKSFSDKKYGGREEAYKQAEAFLKTIQADIVRGEYLDPHQNKITLSDYKQEVGIVKTSQRETTKLAKEEVWETYIAPFDIAYKSIGSIKPTDIRKHILSLKKESGEDYSHSTITKIVELFRILFRKALEEGRIKGINPASTSIVKDVIPKKHKSKHIYLDKFQVNNIFKDLQEHSPRYAVAIPLLAYSGLRSGELRALTYDDIDFNSGLLTVNKSFSDKAKKVKVSDPKTDSSIRTIKLPKYVVNYLREHKKLYKTPECNYIFPNQRGNQNGSKVICDNPILGKNFKNRHLKPSLKRLGLDPDINLHTFRHTSVRLARESGADLVSVSKRLGHKSITLTADTYSDLFENIDNELVDNLEKYMEEVV